jgi:outer membrane protein
MTFDRRSLARSFVAAVGLSLCAPLAVFAQGQPNTQPIQVPTPAPMPTTSGTPIPYPAYGSPAPDVAQQRPKPNVPASVTLKQAVDIAVLEAPSFEQDRAAYAQIAAKYSAAKLALTPNISAAGDITRNWGQSSEGATPSPSAVKGYYTTEDGSVTIKQLIFDGGQLLSDLRAAKFENEAGKQTLMRQLEQLEYTVASDYYTLLEDKAAVASDNQLVREFEINEQYVVAQIRTGAAARSDLAAAQFQTAQARGSLVAAQGAEIQAQAAFSTFIGLDADALIVPMPLDKSPTQVKTSSYLDSLKEALNLRPDYLAAQATVVSAKASVLAAELGRMPTVTASGTASTSRILIGSPAAMSGWEPGGSIGASISLPIWDQGQTTYNVAVAKATLDSDNASLVQTRLQVQSDVRGGLAGLFSARAQLVQAESEVTSSTVSLQATQAQYRVGASTITAIVTAEANLATAQHDYVTALYGERLAEQNYLLALGSNDLNY